MQKEKTAQFKYGRIPEEYFLLLLPKRTRFMLYSSNLEFVQAPHIFQFKTQWLGFWCGYMGN